MADLPGLSITPAPTGLVTALVRAVVTTDPALPDEVSGLAYVYAAYQHGYDLAYRDQRSWVWGSAVFANHRPGHPRSGPESGLERIRLYGGGSELVVARIAGCWHGWWHRPVPEPAGGSPLGPRPRSYLVCTGTGVQAMARFTRIEQGSGQFSVLPHPFPPGRLGYAHTREYFTADPETGAVRVAAVTWTGYGAQPHRLPRAEV